ncbi:hypothetical protein ACP275_05G026300 [Erythranthe tilingii]
MKYATAILFIVAALLLTATGSNATAAAAAARRPPKCRTNQNCRVYCSTVGTTPLCLSGVCTCYLKKNGVHVEAQRSTSEYNADQKSSSTA